jgi:hypothetical protein
MIAGFPDDPARRVVSRVCAKPASYDGDRLASPPAGPRAPAGQATGDPGSNPTTR